MEVREVLRHLRAAAPITAIQDATGLNRRTIMRYRSWAQTQGLLDPEQPLPALETLHVLQARTLTPPAPPQTVSTVEPYRELVARLHAQGVEGAALWQRLREQGYTGSLSSVYRFLHRLAPTAASTATVRIERAPGQEAQVDFGYAGLLIDPATVQLRRAWAFVMVLAYSRHLYVEFVFDQKVPTWIVLHQHAFAFFGGVPERVVLDNLKAGITRACFDDPQIQPTYRECAEHYGFLIAPCAPRTPEHKGKVEQGVHYVKRNFLAGRTPTLVPQANADVREWCLTTAGTRVHGTTKQSPLQRFQAEEQAQLRPLPATPYDLAQWKRVRLHRDGYVVFEQAFYSAPFRFIGQPLWVRGGSQEVRLYSAEYALVATHARAQPGERRTHPDHLPPQKVPGALWTMEQCLALAHEVGPATEHFIQAILGDPIVDRHPRAVRVLRLRSRVGDARLEAACARAVHFGDLSYATLKRILELGLESQPLSADDPSPAPKSGWAFMRSATDLLGHVVAAMGGKTWN